MIKNKSEMTFIDKIDPSLWLLPWFFLLQKEYVTLIEK